MNEEISGYNAEKVTISGEEGKAKRFVNFWETQICTSNIQMEDMKYTDCYKFNLVK